MRQTLTLATASINTLPLDLEGNSALIQQAIVQAQQANADLLLLPELVLSGYGAEDMFFAADWLAQIPQVVTTLIGHIPQGMLVAVGLPVMIPGGQIFNGVALLSHKQIIGISLKQNLARSGVHYEPRWFTPWPAGTVSELVFAGTNVPIGDLVYDIDGVRIGFEICEDSWVASRPARSLYQRQTDVILNPSASHFSLGKQTIREQFVTEGSRAFGAAYMYANLLGCEAGRTVYDGGNLIASNGTIVMRGQRMAFAPVVVESAHVDLMINRTQRIISSQQNIPTTEQGVVYQQGILTPSSTLRPLTQPQPAAPMHEHEELCRTIALGLWDWMRKTYTKGFAVSLSGGADSALCTTLCGLAQHWALEELGELHYLKILHQCGIAPAARKKPQSIETWLHNVVMPLIISTVYQGSQNSSDTTKNAAQQLADGLGCSHADWSIDDLVEGYTQRINALTPDNPMSWEQDDLTLQNIQARVRAPGIWMLANRQNKLLLATSNLSEASVGYCTMDGDTSGVLAPIGGVSKSRVLDVLKWLYEQGHHYLHGIIVQQPTAELRPVEQSDENDLMPFEILDAIRHITQTHHAGPKVLLQAMCRLPLAQTYTPVQLAAFIQRYYGLYCRNQWKRERLAVSFHIETDSADPKTYRRFPVLNSQMRNELNEMIMEASSL